MQRVALAHITAAVVLACAAASTAQTADSPEKLSAKELTKRLRRIDAVVYYGGVMVARGDTLRGFEGKNELVFIKEEDPPYAIKTKPFVAPATPTRVRFDLLHDLNGDGFSDMIIYYPESSSLKGSLEVLVNRCYWE